MEKGCALNHTPIHQSLRIISPPISRPLDAGAGRAGAALLVVCALVFIAATLRAEGLRLAVFGVDATPPVGSMMAYDPVGAQGELGLRCRGVILPGADKPIVLHPDFPGLARFL